MPWGSKTTATQITSITTTTSYFDEEITLGFNEEAHVQVEANLDDTPTAGIVFVVERTLDDTAEQWDTVPYLSFSTGTDDDPYARSFDLIGGYKYRIGVYEEDAGDAHTSADMSYRILSP